MPENSFNIYALKVGERVADSTFRLYLTDAGQPATNYYYFWCILFDSEAILVDTGFPEDLGRERGILNYSPPENLLGRLGVTTADVSTIILTHLHWDHSAGVRFYPWADVIFQKEDLDFFTGPLGDYSIINRFIVSKEEMQFLARRPGTRIIDGEFQVAPGIRAYRVGGHTAGSQIVVIDTPKGRVILCGDACPSYRNLDENLPAGIHYSVPECLAALEKIRSLAGEGALIIPGHDPLVYLQYEKVDEGIVKLI